MSNLNIVKFTGQLTLHLHIILDYADLTYKTVLYTVWSHNQSHHLCCQEGYVIVSTWFVWLLVCL